MLQGDSRLFGGTFWQPHFQRCSSCWTANKRLIVNEKYEEKLKDIIGPLFV